MIHAPNRMVSLLIADHDATRVPLLDRPFVRADYQAQATAGLPCRSVYWADLHSNLPNFLQFQSPEAQSVMSPD